MKERKEEKLGNETMTKEKKGKRKKKERVTIIQ